MKERSRKQFSSEGEILKEVFAFRKSKMILTACELGLFTVIGNSALSAKEISFELNTDEKATARWLNGLVTVDFLQKVGDKYANFEFGKKYLVEGSEEYIGNMLHATHQWEVWGTLTETLKRGTAVADKSLQDMEQHFVNAYLESVHLSYAHEAEGVVSMIRLKEVNKFLDLGCGSCFFTSEFIKQKPELDVTVYDFPKIINEAKNYLAKENLEHRVTYIEGNFHDLNFGSGYDLIFASFICDEFSLWENIDIMKACYNALNKNGCLVIHDNVMNNDRISPEHSVLYSMNQLLNTAKGDVYTENDLWIMLKESGFSEVKSHDTNFGTKLFFGKRTW